MWAVDRKKRAHARIGCLNVAVTKNEATPPPGLIKS
jgi:hypothetical protein